MGSLSRGLGGGMASVYPPVAYPRAGRRRGGAAFLVSLPVALNPRRGSRTGPRRRARAIARPRSRELLAVINEGPERVRFGARLERVQQTSLRRRLSHDAEMLVNDP